jgi:anaerobic magnesium-protoporphyrin IX monomethyl ester cyclase
MRILFVSYDLYMEPLGILYLSSVVKQAGHETELAVINDEDVVAIARRFQPDVVAHSLHTGVQPFHLSLNSRLKQEMAFFAAFGGPHPTFFPEIIEDRDVDGVCLGEGEGALLHLVERLQAGRSPGDLQNWWIRDDGHVERNSLAPLVEDLDTIPFPDRELLRPKEHLLKYPGQRSIMTARGCPYRCSYCFNHAYVKLYGGKGNRVRRRSVDNVVEEALQLKSDYGAQFIYFADDTFNLMDGWLAEFAEKYPRKVGLPFLCNIRANVVNEERMRAIAQAGAYSVCMGIETGNEELRNTVLKRGMTDEQIYRAASIVHDLGLRLYTTNMLGNPGSSLEHDFETVRINQAIKPHATSVTLLQPYPRTEIRDYAASLGLIEGTVEDIPWSYARSTVIKMEPKQRRQVENLHHLFGLLVQVPWLTRPSRFLIKLPLTRLYLLFYMVFNEYLTRARIFKPAPSLRFYGRTIKSRLKGRWPFHMG